MAQSVELTLDDAADAAVVEQWDRLADAGLPSLRRSRPDENHRPHITLWAGPVVEPDVELALPGVVADLDLTVHVGSLMLFGPHREGYILVRLAVPSAELLGLQRQVTELCRSDPYGQFGPGEWTPHVTLARRIEAAQLPRMLAVLGPPHDLEARITRCRRWDGERKSAWWLTRG